MPHANPFLRFPFTRSPAHIAVAACVLMAAHAHAQTIAPRAEPPGTDAQPAASPVQRHQQLEGVTVTGNPLGSADLIAPTSVLGGSELLLRRGSSLGETLDGTPGVSTTYFGPVASRPTIRGQDGDRIRLMTNGSASQDVSALSFDHAVAIDPLAIERIEVLRGPGALQYGGSAVGGSVNVITHRIHEGPLFDAQGGNTGKALFSVGGAARERGGSVVLDAGNDRFVAHVDAFDKRSGDVRVPLALPCDQAGSGTPATARALCNSDATARGAAVGGTLLFDHGYLGASVEGFRTTYGSVAEDTVTIGMQQSRTTVRGEWRALPAGLQSVKAQWSGANYQHTEYSGGAPGTAFKNRGGDWGVELRHQPLRWGVGTPSAYTLEGVVAWQGEGGRFSAMGDEAFVPNTRSDNRALFVFEELRLPGGKLNGALRWERVQVDANGHPTLPRFNVAQRRFNPFSAALGGLWEVGGPSSGVTATANLASTQRAPRDYELYANGPHLATGAYEVGDANLGLERGQHLDLGLARQSGPHKLAFNAYLNRFQNYIGLQASGNQRDTEAHGVSAAPCANGKSAESGCNADILPEYRFAGQRARFVGAEFSSQTRLVGNGGLAAGRQPLALHLKLDAVRATNSTTGEPLPRIAPLRVGAELQWADNHGSLGWRARLGINHHTAQNRVPSTERSVAGYTLVHAALSYTGQWGGTQWQAFVRGDNLTNRLAYSATSMLTQSAPGRVPLPGRSIKVGVQVAF